MKMLALEVIWVTLPANEISFLAARFYTIVNFLINEAFVAHLSSHFNKLGQFLHFEIRNKSDF